MFSQKWDEICNEGEEEFNALFENEDVKLTDLLDSDDCIAQLENGNELLLNFLDEPSHFSQLVAFITDMPAADADQRRSFRYPFYACQLLKDPQQYIYNKHFQEGYLTQVLVLLDREVNEVLAGYLYQILETLATRRTFQFLHFFLLQHPHYVDTLFKHVHLNSITKAIALFLSFDVDANLQEEDQRIKAARQVIVTRVLEHLHASTGEIRENLLDSLSVLEFVKENFDGPAILEFLINHPLFLQLASQPYAFRLLFKFLSAIFPQEKPTTQKFFKKQLVIDSTSLQLRLADTISHRIACYSSNSDSRFRVHDLDFFVMAQRFSLSKTQTCRTLFARDALWIGLMQCLMKYPKANMMHIEVAKIIRNGITYALESGAVSVESLSRLVAFLHSAFRVDRTTSKFYFGYLMHISFQLRRYAADCEGGQDIWIAFEEEALRPEIEKGNTPLDDMRLIDPYSPMNVNTLQIDNELHQQSPIRLKLVQLD